MRIATYLSVLAAAGIFALGCEKKKDEPAPKPTEKSEPTPAPAKPEEKTPAPVKETLPVPPPPVDPEPEIDPAAEPVVDPVPTPDEAPATLDAEPAAASDEHQAVFDKGLKVMDSLFTALEEATDVDDAVVRLTALEPDFKAIGEEMASVGEPDEASAAAFNAQLEPLKDDYQARAQTSMFKLMNLDPAALQGGTPDPAVLEKLQEDGQKIGEAIATLMGHYEGAWKSVGN